MLFGPRSNRSESGAEVVRHDVIGLTDEQGSIPQVRVSLDVVDHLRVVVGGEHRLGGTAVRHGEPADEVGEPAERGAFQFGILVEEAVELPRLVADPQVVGLAPRRRPRRP